MSNNRHIAEEFDSSHSSSQPSQASWSENNTPFSSPRRRRSCRALIKIASSRFLSVSQDHHPDDDASQQQQPSQQASAEDFSSPRSVILFSQKHKSSPRRQQTTPCTVRRKLLVGVNHDMEDLTMNGLDAGVASPAPPPRSPVKSIFKVQRSFSLRSPKRFQDTGGGVGERRASLAKTDSEPSVAETVTTTTTPCTTARPKLDVNHAMEDLTMNSLDAGVASPPPHRSSVKSTLKVQRSRSLHSPRRSGGGVAGRRGSMTKTGPQQSVSETALHCYSPKRSPGGSNMEPKSPRRVLRRADGEAMPTTFAKIHSVRTLQDLVDSYEVIDEYDSDELETKGGSSNTGW